MKQVKILQATNETIKTLRRVKDFFPSKDMTMGKKAKAQEEGFVIPTRHQSSSIGPFDVKLVDNSHATVYDSCIDDMSYGVVILGHTSINVSYPIDPIALPVPTSQQASYQVLYLRATAPSGSTIASQLVFDYLVSGIRSHGSSNTWLYPLAIFKIAYGVATLAAKINSPSIPEITWRFI